MRSVADIFRSHSVLDADGRHTNGTDKETNHHYGTAYEALFAANANLCSWMLDGSTRYCYKCESDTSHLRTCPLFKPTRESVRRVMEVGVADGSSLLAWREVFPNALCVGLDIHPSRHAAGERIEFHLGDATDYDACQQAAGGRQFDLIVDDATHLLPDTLTTLLYLWPHVRAGGMYVVEEFANVGALRDHIAAMWPFVEFINTQGPFGGIEPLVVLRRPI